jgi:superfamily II DNA or RNA helicase
MIFLVKNGVTISGVDTTKMVELTKALTIINPLFERYMEMSIPTWNIKNRLTYFKMLSKTSIEIPVGAFVLFLNSGLLQATKGDIIDQRLSETSDLFNNVTFSGKLRDYQQKIVDACNAKTIGVIQSPTGSGKTLTFTKLIVDKKVPTLILVNTIELANQTVAAISRNTNIPEDQIGMIGQGKFIIKPITVALHQTMTRLTNEHFKIFNELFGMIICDETHIIAADTFYDTISRLNAKYKYGFSATPERDDGLTKVINFANGPVICKVSLNEVEDHIIRPRFEFKVTNYFFPLISSQDYQAMISDLSSDEDRNAFIANELKLNFKDNYVVLLCARKEQVETLKNLIGDEAVVLTSDIPKKLRKQAIEDLNSKKIRHVVSTYGLFSTGIDIPHLDTLFFCAPIKSTIKVKQSIGRIMRPAKDKKEAIVVDFVDQRVDLLMYQSRTRKNIYQEYKK